MSAAARGGTGGGPRRSGALPTVPFFRLSPHPQESLVINMSPSCSTWVAILQTRGSYTPTSAAIGSSVSGNPQTDGDAKLSDAAINALPMDGGRAIYKLHQPGCTGSPCGPDVYFRSPNAYNDVHAQRVLEPRVLHGYQLAALTTCAFTLLDVRWPLASDLQAEQV